MQKREEMSEWAWENICSDGLHIYPCFSLIAYNHQKFPFPFSQNLEKRHAGLEFFGTRQMCVLVQGKLNIPQRKKRIVFTFVWLYFDD